MSLGPTAVPNVSQSFPTNSRVEAMFQQILLVVHKSVSGRVVRCCYSLVLTLWWLGTRNWWIEARMRRTQVSQCFFGKAGSGRPSGTPHRHFGCFLSLIVLCICLQAVQPIREEWHPRIYDPSSSESSTPSQAIPFSLSYTCHNFYCGIILLSSFAAGR